MMKHAWDWKLCLSPSSWYIALSGPYTRALRYSSTCRFKEIWHVGITSHMCVCRWRVLV